MAINGLLTDVGLTESQIALNNEGWFIFPTRFEVAETAGTFDKTRVGGRDWIGATPYAVGDLVVPTTPNGFYYVCSVDGVSAGSEPDWPTSPGSVVDGGVTWDFVGASSGGLEPIWYSASISTRIEAPPNTIEIVLTIPPGADPSNKDINEIYIFAEDQPGAEFLLAVGQPTATITYDKDGSTSLRLAITLTNVDISGLFVFKYTQATEIAEHSTDPNAHPDIRDLIRIRFSLLPNGDAAVDRNPSGFSLATSGLWGFGAAEWAGMLQASGSVAGNLIRKIDSVIEGSRSFHFSSVSLSGGSEELHFRHRMRGATARLLSNKPWEVSADYVVGQVVVPTSSPTLRFRATQAGTSDSVEPAWPTLVGDTISDGSVEWVAVLGNSSFGMKTFQDTGGTQFAVISFRTPDALDDFEGAGTVFLTSGATDHPMLDNTVSRVRREAMVFPDVDNGIEIEITVDVGVLASKNFEFTQLKLEPTEVATTFTGIPNTLEELISNPFIVDLLDFRVVVGTQAQVDSGAAHITINELDSFILADGDRILILDGTHTLTGNVVLTNNNLVIVGVSPSAIIDQDATYTFDLQGTNCVMNAAFINTLTDGVILSGAGSFFQSPDFPLTDVDTTNSIALTGGVGGGLEVNGFTISSTGDVTFANITGTKQLLGFDGISYDKIVGSAGEVASGKATHEFDAAFFSALNSNDRVFFRSGFHTMDADRDFTQSDLHIFFDTGAEIVGFDGTQWTLTFSGTRIQTYTAKFTAGSFGNGDIDITGINCLIQVALGAASLFDVTGAGSTVIDENGGFKSAVYQINGLTGSFGNVFIVTTEGSPYTFGTNGEKVLLVNETEDMVVNIPTAVGILGQIIIIKNQMPSNVVTIGADGSETIDDQPFLFLDSQYQSATLISDGSNWSII